MSNQKRKTNKAADCATNGNAFQSATIRIMQFLTPPYFFAFSSSSHQVGRGLLLSLCFVLNACSSTGVITTPIASQFPLENIRTPQQAELARQQVAAERTRIAKEAETRQYECYKKFLANSCISDLKSDRLQADRALTAVDIEARRIQREDRFARDSERLQEKAETSAKEVEEKAEDRARKAAEFAARQAENEAKQAQAAEEARLATARGEKKRAEQAVRMQEKTAQEQAAAAAVNERAEKRNEFAQKQEEARAHAEDVAKKRAEKEAEKKAKKQADKVNTNTPIASQAGQPATTSQK